MGPHRAVAQSWGEEILGGIDAERSLHCATSRRANVDLHEDCAAQLYLSPAICLVIPRNASMNWVRAS
jgi:hypothetical protein